MRRSTSGRRDHSSSGRARARRGSGRPASWVRHRSPCSRRRSAGACRAPCRTPAGGRRRRRSGRPTRARPSPPPGPGSSRRRPTSARAAVRVTREAPVDPAAEADRPRARAHEHAAVGGRPEVVEEHAAVGDRLAAGPADLREQLGHRLGEDDVAAEGRQHARERLPAGPPGVHGDDDLARPDDPALRLEQPVADARDVRPLVQTDAGGERLAGAGPARAAPGGRLRRRGRRRRAGTPATSSGAPARRGRAVPPPPRRRARGRRRPSGRGSRPAPGDVDTRTSPPSRSHVVAEAAHSGDRPVRRARDREAPLGAEHVAEAGQARPVAVEEAAVAAARPDPATRGLEHDHVQPGLPPLQLERRPEPR